MASIRLQLNLAFLILHFWSAPPLTSLAPNNVSWISVYGPRTESSRQNGFFEWLASILRPTTPSTTTTSTTPTTTTTPKVPQRECTACTCGSVNAVRRIVGGQETVVHAYPWMALLLANGDFYCGASLISDLHVVTAAHCVIGIPQRVITVRLLEHDRHNSSVYVVDRRAALATPHERYSSTTYDSDLALIRLSQPVEFNERLRPVCMPALGSDFAGELAVATGWGALGEGGAVSNTLQEVEVPIMSQEECYASQYGPSRITDNMLCAGLPEGGKDSCQGDSGGPLHFRVGSAKQHQLVGIVSWGEGCAKPNLPGVYTRVNRFNDWIAQRTSDGCRCTSMAAQSEPAVAVAAGSAEVGGVAATMVMAMGEIQSLISVSNDSDTLDTKVTLEEF